jgi:hypothetical protein
VLKRFSKQTSVIIICRNSGSITLFFDSIGKPVFPCERVDARWGKLECEQKACEIVGSTSIFGKIY